MSNTPPPQIQMPQQGQGNLITIIAGVAAIVVTQLGTSFSNQAGVSQVRENQVLMVQDIKQISEANRDLNQKIIELSRDNQRLNEANLKMSAEILERLKK